MSRRPIDVDELARIIDPEAFAAPKPSIQSTDMQRRVGEAYRKAARVIALVASCMDLSIE